PLCLFAGLLSLLCSAKLRERLAQSCVRRGIGGVKSQRLLVGRHCLIIASKSGKDASHAHVGGRVWCECHCLLKGDQSLVVAFESNEGMTLASQSVGVGTLLAERLLIGVER